MASSSQGPAAGLDLPALKTQIYDACLEAIDGDYSIVFHQTDIQSLEIIPNNNALVLLEVMQGLVDDKLFKMVNQPGGAGGSTVGWILRTRDEAKKYRSLNQEQEIVYGLIDEAGSDGIWARSIKMRLNLHDAVFAKAIKALEVKNMISDMKSVEHPTRKLYIKASLRPSERATGGPWYTNGELDEAFVEAAIKYLHQLILKKTFYVSRSYASSLQPKRILKKMTPEEVKAARDKGLGPRTEVVDEKTKRGMIVDSYLPMPPGWQGYFTANELTLKVETSSVFTQTLMETDIQKLLDIMCYDNIIEKIEFDGVVSYRALRRSLLGPDEQGSRFAEIPCGRCPVFNLCEEGGPVAPSNCEYFDEWLNP